jgi:hypothetical protein
MIAPEVWSKYVTISGLADEANNKMSTFEVGSPQWHEQWGVARSLREAAIILLEDEK